MTELPTGLGEYEDEELIAELKERGVVEFTTPNRGQIEFSTGYPQVNAKKS